MRQIELFVILAFASGCATERFASADWARLAAAANDPEETALQIGRLDTESLSVHLLALGLQSPLSPTNGRQQSLHRLQKMGSAELSATVSAAPILRRAAFRVALSRSDLKLATQLAARPSERLLLAAMSGDQSGAKAIIDALAEQATATRESVVDLRAALSILQPASDEHTQPALHALSKLAAPSRALELLKSSGAKG